MTSVVAYTPNSQIVLNMGGIDPVIKIFLVKFRSAKIQNNEVYVKTPFFKNLLMIFTSFSLLSTVTGVA